MQKNSAPYEQKVILVMVDLSGYTKFMVENRLSAVHGQIYINMLIESILSEVDIPLKLQEIEGDALFLYATHAGGDDEWQTVFTDVRVKLMRFFEAFYSAVNSVGGAPPCHCEICQNAEELKLKMVVHVGTAVFHDVAGLPQVSGTDVILVHRLLKNSVPSDEYILMSAPAYENLGAKMEGDFTRGREMYDSFGAVETYTQYLGEVRNDSDVQFFQQSPAQIILRSEAYVFSSAWTQFTELMSSAFGSSEQVSLAGRLRYLSLAIFGLPMMLLVHPIASPWKLFTKRRKLIREGKLADS